MKIYLCRHGQTTGDVEDRYGGDYDDHLTELGESEAEELALKLQGKGIKKIFASPKIRAQETAKILSEALTVEIETVADLRERNQNGILTGMIRAQAKEEFPQLVERLKDYRNTIEGAESYNAFAKRVNEAVDQIAAQVHDKVAVVTHGGPIRATLRRIDYAPDYKIEDCAFAELEAKDGKLAVISLNGIEPIK